MEVKKLKRGLDPTQYYASVFKKDYIFLHHTVGPSAQSAIDWWNSKPDHVGTPYIIERNGDIIEVFDPKYWAYALGLKGTFATDIEKASIHIEMVSWGQLQKKGNKKPMFVEEYFSTTGVKIPNHEVITFKNFYRECYYYHSYTPQQIASLKILIKYLVDRFGIKIQSDLSQFWYYNRDLLPRLPRGLWSHSSVRADKSDIMPQKELIDMIYGFSSSSER